MILQQPPILDGLNFISGPPTNIEIGHVYLILFTSLSQCSIKVLFSHINYLYEKYKNKNIRLITITNDNVKETLFFINKKKELFNHPIAIDSNKIIANKYNITNLPILFIINKKGDIEWNGNPLDTKINEILDLLLLK